MKAIEVIAADVQAVEEGNKSALEVLVNLKRLEKELAAAKKQIEDAAYHELLDYPKSKAEAYGAVLELRSTAGRWSFDKVQDYAEAKTQMKAIEEAAKEAYKAAQKGRVLYDEDGVEITPAEFTPGKDAIFISLK